jgi:hypothetical protein
LATLLATVLAALLAALLATLAGLLLAALVLLAGLLLSLLSTAAVLLILLRIALPLLLVALFVLPWVVRHGTFSNGFEGSREDSPRRQVKPPSHQSVPVPDDGNGANCLKDQGKGAA